MVTAAPENVKFAILDDISRKVTRYENCDTLRKRLRECLDDSTSLRAKAMRDCDGIRRYSVEDTENLEALTGCMQNYITIPSSMRRPLDDEFPGKTARTAEEKLLELLKRSGPSGVVPYDKVQASILKKPRRHLDIPKLQDVQESNANAVLSGSLLVHVSLPGRTQDIAQSDSTRFSNVFVDIVRKLHDYTSSNMHDTGSRISTLARVAQIILRIDTKRTAVPMSFWSEFLTVALLKNILNNEIPNGEIHDKAQIFFYACRLYQSIVFHQHVISFLYGGTSSPEEVSTPGRKLRRNGPSISIAMKCTQFFAERPDSSVDHFLQSVLSTKDFRSYVDAYCDVLTRRNPNSGMCTEWIRLFHCIRAGRLDAALLQKSSFEGIETVTAHIETMQATPTVERLQGGSEKIVVLYQKELEKIGDTTDYDPFKLAVLLCLSGKCTSASDVAQGMAKLYVSDVFQKSSSHNFIWVALQFSVHLSVRFLVDHFMKAHPAQPAIQSLGETQKIEPLPLRDQWDSDNAIFFDMYETTMLQCFAKSANREDEALFRVYFGLVLHPEKTDLEAGLYFWRDHMISVLNSMSELPGDNLSSDLPNDDNENTIIRGLKKALLPLHTVFTSSAVDDPARFKQLPALAYCFHILGLFPIKKRCELLVELYIAQSTGLIIRKDCASLFETTDTKGVHTSVFFSALMNYASSSDVSNMPSDEEHYVSKMREIMRTGDMAKSRGFTHIFIRLLLDAYIFFVHRDVIKAETCENTLEDIISALMTEIERNDFRNAFGIVDMAFRLRECLIQNPSRIKEAAHRDFLTFLAAVSVYRSLREVVLPIEEAKSDEPCDVLDSDINGAVRKVEYTSIREALEITIRGFEDIYRRTECNDSVTFSESDSTLFALQKSCSLFVRFIVAVEGAKLPAFTIRSYPELHGRITQFIVWTNALAGRIDDENLMSLTQPLADEFLGDSSFL